MKRKFGQPGQRLLALGSLLACSFGCAGGPGRPNSPLAQNQPAGNPDARSAKVADVDEPPVVRSQNPSAVLQAPTPVPQLPVAVPQNPGIVVPEATPVTPAANVTASVPNQIQMPGEPQVVIVATIGTTAIYEREVREAVYQIHLRELLDVPTFERKAKEQEYFREELHRTIERELILSELFAMMGEEKHAAILKQLKEGAAKEAEQRIRDIQKRAKIDSSEEFKIFLQAQGLTLTGLRRGLERGFMMHIYVEERVKPKINAISLNDIKDYYAANPKEFAVPDRVKWQDIFVRADRFKTYTDAKTFADYLLKVAKNGEDFGKLVDRFDNGNCKELGGFGFGEERGKISPTDLEQTVFSLKQGEVALVEFEGAGFHVVRVAERTMAGMRPLDEKLQDEIRKKLQLIVNEKEYRQIIKNLWRRSQPQILVD